MPQFNEVKVKRILNETSINLGDYVINPFMGCQFSCLYCYVRSNRVVSRKKEPWGEYVDIRLNAPELLEKEIVSKKPQTVLLGSTTDCFQPVERKYRIARRILEVLNRHKVYYVILTRSPLILDYLALLKEGFCRKIYFTINKLKPDYKLKLEPKSPSFELRDEAVNKLFDEGLPVVPYFSPVLPWISETDGVFRRFQKADTVEFECLNFNLGNMQDIINAAASLDKGLEKNYQRMRASRLFYARVWRDTEKGIREEAGLCGKKYNIYIHRLGDYFKNVYTGQDLGYGAV